MGAPLPHDAGKTGNFLRAHVGSTLSAEEILSANRRVIVVCRSDGAGATHSATIMLPPAGRWKDRDWVIVDVVGCGFRLISEEAEPMYGDLDKRSAVRLAPLLSERDGEHDAWGIV
jgi:hypothetical protein